MIAHTVVYTAGYHGRSLEDFFDLLKKFDIQVLADIRANPFSRNSVFSKKQLQSAITDIGIEYVHWGTLGAPQEIRDAFKATQNKQAFGASYSAHLHAHQATLQEISQLIRHKTHCLMCLERDPLSCHRHITTDILHHFNHSTLTICNL
ncbi:MAG: hypothetical protein CMH81_07375 [Nitrospiraceae bacterium]|jgi:uncharacterized protein (DUF488 family)|nr:hypothetical protein [Nitrospiraceae bacterium]|tara:strand:+ start:1672 stop:2118 length:447 start_codon:yes stop_codon:yes gene_type:complete